LSIIYDALKKIGRKTEPQAQGKPSKSGQPWKLYLFFGVIAVAGFFVARGIFSVLVTPLKENVKATAAIKQLPEPKQPPAVVTPQQVPSPLLPAEEDVSREAAQSFVLNGIFFSEEGGYALVNNRIVREGDTINGARVIRITLEEVELQSEDSLIRLPAQGK